MRVAHHIRGVERAPHLVQLRPPIDELRDEPKAQILFYGLLRRRFIRDTSAVKSWHACPLRPSAV